MIIGFFRVSERPYGVFSQWYVAPFEEAGITFPTAEHYMMYHKARLFGDTAIAQEVLRTSEPRKVKLLGRRVRNFNAAVWDQNKVDIVLRGNRLKFQQHPELARILRETGTAALVEATPYDKIWGIGSTDVAHPERWPVDAQNLLGRILMRVREELMNPLH